LTCLTDLTILLSNKCNLRCRYCTFTEDDPEKYILADAGNVKKAVRLFFEHASETPGRHRVLSFNADGEVFITPELLFRSLEYATSFRTGIDGTIVALVTNATLITEEYARRLAGLGVHVTVSIDGEKSVHDQHRVDLQGLPTHQQVLRGIRHLQKAGIPLSFRAVITPETSSGILETFRYLHSLKPVRPVKLRPVRSPEPPFYSDSWVRQFTKDYTACIGTLISENLPVEELPDDAGYFVRLLNENKDRGDYCSSGESMLWMLPDGRLTPCGLLTQGFVCGRINRIDTKTDFVALVRMPASRCVSIDAPVHRSPCVSCRWLPACRGGCPALALEDKPPLCHFYMSLGNSIDRSLKEMKRK